MDKTTQAALAWQVRATQIAALRLSGAPREVIAGYAYESSRVCHGLQSGLPLEDAIYQSEYRARQRDHDMARGCRQTDHDEGERLAGLDMLDLLRSL